MNRDPDGMTTEERDAEVSCLLAKGLVRMHKDAKRLLGKMAKKPSTPAAVEDLHQHGELDAMYACADAKIASSSRLMSERR